jgi:hypothetical protein
MRVEECVAITSMRDAGPGYSVLNIDTSHVFT